MFLENIVESMETSGKPKVSPWSATQIGLHSGPDRNAVARKVFNDEAKVVSTYLQGIHHSRKISHQQVNYSDTVNKLGKFQAEVPVYRQKEDSETKPAGTIPISAGTELKLREYNSRMNEFIKTENHINHRKRMYNSSMGRAAVVDKVMAGTAPIPKHQLFPQKANHVQILALTGTLKAPDANKIPPEVPRQKKWLGDGAGWAK